MKSVRVSWLFFVISVCGVDVLAQEKQLSYEWSPEFNQPGAGLFFSDVAGNNNDGALNVAFSGSAGRLDVAATSTEKDNQRETTLVLKEAYIDFSRYELDFSVGKKRLDWGVGYSYRPLNFILPETLNSTGFELNEGAWIVSAEQFTDSGTLSFLAYDNTHQRQSSVNESAGVGVRYYELLGDWELQALGFYDNDSGGIMGGSASTVIGQSASLHASTLWQHRYTRFTHSSDALNFTNNTIREAEFAGGHQILAGLTYNFSNSTSLLFEYWYDGRSPGTDEWSNLLNAAQQQALIPELSQLLSAGRQVFTATNITQHNVVLHARYDGSKFDPTLDIQIAPEDQGVISTIRVGHEWFPGHSVTIGGRWFGGASDSVYRQLPNESVLFLRLEGSF